jgi:hypothetical protein
MIEKLHAVLGEIAARRQRQRFHGGLAITWWLGLLLGLLLWKTGLPPRAFLPVLAVVLVVVSVAIHIWSRRGMGDPRRIAKDIEHKHPALQTELLAALDQNPDPSSGSLSFLQSRLIIDSLATAERDQWLDSVPRPRLTALRALHLAGAFLFILTASVMLLPRAAKPQVAAVKMAPAAVIEMAVDPGDVEIERGSPLTIQVRFDKAPPAEAILEITDETGVRSMPLDRPFTDPIYQTRLAAVDAPMTYRVIVPEGASKVYTVRVFDLPALKQSEVVLHFPEYLGKAPETIKDPHAFQVAERTRMELSLVTNLPGLSASLVAKKREPLALTTDGDRHQVSEILTESVRYEIVLTDSSGRRNHRKDILDIKVIPNKAPVVEVLLPRKNEKVTPIQEVRLEARIKDDSGILAHGLRYTLDGVKWQELEGKPAPGEKQPVLSQLVDLEAAGAKPNDIVMWNAWAEDLGPDGKKRRVTGDIHLVQVRNFDEEFYQQAAPPGSGPPPAGGDNLVKLQTKILNSTWNLRRDHAEISNTPPPAQELDTLHKSQEIAIEMAAALEAEQTDPSVRKFVTDARLAMKDASALLAEAHTKTSAGPLEPAIGHEQAALRHLYQLMGSKTTIMQSESESSAPPSEDGPKEDLDLKPLENPYKAEKSAQPELAQEANEAMETLKRLDELAKRQRDLNEEMKALQMAMNEADTPEKKAEIERQLKQLRDQQRELLADVDKLQQKTSESAPPDQKQALDDAREKAQQANEQLEDKKLGDALAAGRRAQEELEKLHDDFRETSAAKLAEQLRDLRQDARDLEERQRQLADATPPPGAPKQNRLGEPNGSQPDVARQREDFKQLVDALRETAETAERAEPLVAKDLGEALRQADQNGIAQALDKIGQPGDEKAAEQATEGISKLTREIETAAERILGNEAQALRYARDELKRLAEQAGAEPGKPAAASKPPGEGQTPGEGKQPGATAGEPKKPGEGEQPGQGEGKAPGQGNEPGQTAGEGKQPGQGEGQAPGQGNEPGQTAGEGKQPGQGEGETPGEGQGEGQGQAAGQKPGQGNGPGQSPGQGHGSGNSRGGSAITGGGYEEWRDRLADLEAVVTDPEAQSAVARARRAGIEMRKDFKRHSKEPDQARIENEILRPLAEAATELDARLRELDREDPLAPVSRDPVPDRYNEIVRRYFEELGK